MFRDRYGIAAGRIHHQHSGSRCGRQIDVIDTDARAPDDPQLRRLLQHLRRDLHGAADNQRVSLAPDASRTLSDWKR